MDRRKRRSTREGEREENNVHRLEMKSSGDTERECLERTRVLVRSCPECDGSQSMIYSMKKMFITKGKS